jgi:hypothetical protein
MRNPNSKRKFRAVLKLAMFCGLIFTVTTFLINLYVQYHGGQGEDSWVLTFAVVQSIPFAIFLHFTGIEYVLNKPSTMTLIILSSISDGFWLALPLLIFGSIWQFLMKSGHENKNQTTGI